MAFVHKDLARMSVSAGGAGDLTLGIAVADPVKGYYQTFDAAGVANGDSFPYRIEQGADWETGIGVYTTATKKVSRTLAQSSTSSLLIVTTAADIAITLLGSIVDKMLRADLKGQQISGGARLTLPTALALSGATIAIDPGNGPLLPVSNNGAGLIVPGAYYGVGTFEVINVSGAGSITTTGWTVKGDSFDTSAGSKFLCSYVISANMAVLSILKVA